MKIKSNIIEQNTLLSLFRKINKNLKVIILGMTMNKYF